MTTPELLRIPDRCLSLEDMAATARQLGAVEAVLVCTTADGCTLLLNWPDCTRQNLNFMLDVAKDMVLNPRNDE